MGLKKAISKRVHKARMVGAVVKDSFLVNVKRPIKKRRFYSSQLKAVIVDLDGTLLETDSSLEALKLFFPEKIKGLTKGELIYGRLINAVIDGTMSVDEAMVFGLKKLIEKEFSTDDLEMVFEFVKPKIRMQLAESLKLIQKGMNAKIILATMSSKKFAELINKHLSEEIGFEFDAVLGSEILFEKGKAKKLIKIIGKETKQIGEIQAKSKFDAIQDLLNEKKWNYSLNELLFITDGYGDIEVIKKMPSILLTQKENASLIQTVSKRLRLADFIVQDDENLKEQIVKIVLGTK
ncbi:MAG: HAD family hydrolase [Candidatus Diapherotrites archaeon]